MNDHRPPLIEDAHNLLDETIRLRREIHHHPEVGLDLPKTKEATLRALEGIDLDYAMSNSTTGFVATLQGGKPGRTILLRGDMDALTMPEDTGLEFASEVENRMHACGHDTHTAMLASAAHVLNRYRDQIPGKVKFMFQPGEEGFHGAKIMMDEGLLEVGGAPDGAFAIHIMPNKPAGVIGSRPGTLLASADQVKITVIGKGGHGSMPHDTLDPVPAACEIVSAVQAFVTRRFDIHDPVVVTFGVMQAGTAPNVIPESAFLWATMRSTSPGARQKVREGVQRIAKQISAAHELTTDIELTLGYPPTVNDAQFVDFAKDTAIGMFGEAKWQTLASPIMGAEDFSYVIDKYPGCMAFLGVGPEDADQALQAAPCHSNRMHVHEEALAVGVAYHAGIAWDFLHMDTPSV